MNIASIDHFVITVESIERTCDFYRRALGMQIQQFGSIATPRTALLLVRRKLIYISVIEYPIPTC